MTRQHEAMLISQGHRAPRLRVVNGRCADCHGFVIVARVRDGSGLLAALEATCVNCGQRAERPLSAPRPLPTAADMAPQQRGRPPKEAAQ